VPLGEAKADSFKARGRSRISLKHFQAKHRLSVHSTDFEGSGKGVERIPSHDSLDRIIKMDETSYRLLNSRFVTVAGCGSERVDCLCEGDPKMRSTATAAFDAGGGPFPLWVLCRGRTTRCERGSQNDDVLARTISQGQLVASHQANGRVNAQVLGNYLLWLRNGFEDVEIVFMWVCSLPIDMKRQTPACQSSLGLSSQISRISSRVIDFNASSSIALEPPDPQPGPRPRFQISS
jgi:hypothetical protein